MNLYECRYDNDWICYVFAETRGKAKHLFNKDFGNDENDFIWVRCRFIGKSDRIKTPMVVDSDKHEDYPAVLELCDGYTPEVQE